MFLFCTDKTPRFYRGTGGEEMESLVLNCAALGAEGGCGGGWRHAGRPCRR